MKLELDHLFICVQPEAPEAQYLKDFGLIEGLRRTHRGQGTANVCFFFQNAYLELLWLRDATESQSPFVRPTGLWERCRWRETQACPFGFAARKTETDSGKLPFSTWDYRAPFLPRDRSIPIATNSSNLAEPLIFIPPARHIPSPDSLKHRLPLGKISEIRATLSGKGSFSPEVKKVMELGVVQFSHGDRAHLEIEFDGSRNNQIEHFAPVLPLSIRW